jgi:hypothetical protein
MTVQMRAARTGKAHIGLTNSDKYKKRFKVVRDSLIFCISPITPNNVKK